jgi:hypothetical protein
MVEEGRRPTRGVLYLGLTGFTRGAPEFLLSRMLPEFS